MYPDRNGPVVPLRPVVFFAHLEHTTKVVVMSPKRHSKLIQLFLQPQQARLDLVVNERKSAVRTLSCDSDLTALLR